MLTLIATAIGLISSAFPEVLNTWKEKENKNHEIKLLEMRMQSQHIDNELRLQKANVKAETSEITSVYENANLPSNITWIEGLRASVRPVITYAFFILFATVKVSVLIALVQAGSGLAQGIRYIWDPETAALFATIMGFWFGHRALQRHKELSK